MFKKILIGLFLLVALLWASNSLATTYYISNTGCSDSNAGTSSSAPWCHCPGLVGWTGSTTLSPGDTVYFDSSSTWSASSNQVLNVTGGVTYIGNAWGTGTRAVFAATAALTCGLVRMTSDDPTYPTVVQGFEINGNDQYANGVNMNHVCWSVPLTGAMKTIQNCLIHNIGANGSAGYYDYGIMLTSQDASTPVSNVQVLNNVVHDIARGAIMLYPGPDNSYLLSNVTVRGNETFNTGQEADNTSGLGQGCIIKNNVTTALIEFNNFHGSNGTYGTAVQINNDIVGGTGPVGVSVRYNILNNTDGSGMYIQNNGVGRTLDFYGNIVYNSGLGFGVEVNANNTGSLSLKFYNNTFYNNYVDIGNYSATTTVMEFENNIVYTLSGQTPLSDPAGKITAHNNNTYYRVGGGTLVSSGGTSYTSSNLTTYEATGFSSDPLFVNTSNLPTGFTGTYGINEQPNNNGLALQTSSPDLGSGAILGSAYNSSINSITRPSSSGWDRGAYQTGSNIPAPPTNLSIVP